MIAKLFILAHVIVLLLFIAGGRRQVSFCLPCINYETMFILIICEAKWVGDRQGGKGGAFGMSDKITK